MTELPNSKNKGNSYIFKNVATLYDLDRRIEYPLPIDKQDITVGRFDPENDQEKADVQIETDDIYMSHIQIHIFITPKDDGYFHKFTTDKNAVNNVFFNGEETKKDQGGIYPLENGNLLCLPMTRIIVIDKDRTDKKE